MMEEKLATNLLYYFAVHGYPDRALSEKHMLYQSMTGDYSGSGLAIANKLISAKQLDNAFDRNRTKWLNFTNDLPLEARLALRLTVCDVVNPTEFRLIRPLAFYLLEQRAHRFIEMFEDYLQTRSSHKVYGDMLLTFDGDSSWSPKVGCGVEGFLKATQLDYLAKGLLKDLIESQEYIIT